MIKVLIMDIDGVLTDGRIYTDGNGKEWKSLNLKDIDAITSIREAGVIVGCLSGENTSFSRTIRKYVDFAELGCKQKANFLDQYTKREKINLDEICYVGDGKYDLEPLQMVGLSACPADAISRVRNIVDIVLNTKAGCGCIDELCDIIYEINKNNN